VDDIGSPIWLSLVLAAVFYALAVIRGVRSAEVCLSLALMVLTVAGPRTLDLQTMTAPNVWPLAILAVFQLGLGVYRSESRLTLIGCVCSIAVLQVRVLDSAGAGQFIAIATSPSLIVMSILIIGATFRDDFARLLRLTGAPLLVLCTVAGLALVDRQGSTNVFWIGPLFVVLMTVVSWSYGSVVQMRVYQLASLLCGTAGSLGLAEMAAVYFIRESGWQGAMSFVTGIACLMIAAGISSWKAGWLKGFANWMRSMLVSPIPDFP
jgi:hypothetical protein